ncbi:hypothetical protein A5636_17130 [Mycobacterium asiaticum]|uniref:Uncharacterized protein n=1 Tax=Mycobacterium asiaticum TaxID=1790 RepID=A0A1A3NCR1_MYCAS|nr:hypothetical protein A5636_17130 [Mycobacterium asiaticum]
MVALSEAPPPLTFVGHRGIFVEAALRSHRRHDDAASARCEYSVELVQCAGIVRDVLQNVGAQEEVDGGVGISWHVDDVDDVVYAVHHQIRGPVMKIVPALQESRERRRRRELNHAPSRTGRQEAVDVELVEPVPVSGTTHRAKVPAMVQCLEII